jgi:hypothetical protein
MAVSANKKIRRGKGGEVKGSSGIILFKKRPSVELGRRLPDSPDSLSTLKLWEAKQHELMDGVMGGDLPKMVKAIRRGAKPFLRNSTQLTPFFWLCLRFNNGEVGLYTLSKVIQTAKDHLSTKKPSKKDMATISFFCSQQEHNRYPLIAALVAYHFKSLDGPTDNMPFFPLEPPQKAHWGIAILFKGIEVEAEQQQRKQELL